MKSLWLSGLSLVLGLATLASASADVKLQPKSVKTPHRLVWLRPDLTVTGIVAFKNTMAAKITVKNIGILKSKGVWMRVKIYTPSGPLGSNVLKAIRIVYVPALAAGQSTSMFINTAPVVIHGGVRLDAFVDFTHLLPESNEGNNVRIHVVPWF